MGKLDGKTAIITGATGGIGRAASRLFAAEGARLLLVDLDEAALSELARSIGGDGVEHAAADVSDAERTQAFVAQAVARFGGIDIGENCRKVDAAEVRPQEQRLRAGPADDIGNLGAAVARVDHDGDGADPGRGDEQGEPFRAVRQPERDPVARADAEAARADAEAAARAAAEARADAAEARIRQLEEQLPYQDR